MRIVSWSPQLLLSLLLMRGLFSFSLVSALPDVLHLFVVGVRAPLALLLLLSSLFWSLFWSLVLWSSSLLGVGGACA